MKEEICECCKGNPVQPNTKGRDFLYTWTCPYCDKTGKIKYKWWEWYLILVYRKMIEIDERQIGNK